MEKKPIKRNENIVKLSQDHHASLMFCWKLRQGVKYEVPVQRMIKYVQYFWEHHFSIHFKEEEEFLFASLNDDKIQKALDDHQKIKTFINEINNTGSESPLDIIWELADMVDEHVRYEERILFPHLESALTQNELENIGRQISSIPLKDSFEDNFWIRPKTL
jgi:hemerythrin-like domain-containing protein